MTGLFAVAEILSTVEESFNLKKPEVNNISVKEAVFPFVKFPGVDTILGPEMKSTGEVMGLDVSFERAFAKSQLGGGTVLPGGGAAWDVLEPQWSAMRAR